MRHVQIIDLAALLGGICGLLSWLIYVPIYLAILRRKAPDLYAKLGGIPFLGARQLFYLSIFLFKGDYRASRDATVCRHSRILAVTLYGGLAVAVAGTSLRYLTEV
jgi:hypothetical protein